MPDLGKRYECESCAGEVLCTKPGPGSMSCCGVSMTIKVAKPLPSSD
jgi:hypothetical protein